MMLLSEAPETKQHLDLRRDITPPSGEACPQAI
jgi:hypothetical protein